MKIYAIHDRLIDFWMRPFAAPDNKEVMHSLATQVNNDENVNPINQAPHQFDLYELGHIDEQGNLHAERKQICTLSSLIRARAGQPETHPLAREDGGNGARN
jgi:hypothetical protein